MLARHVVHARTHACRVAGSCEDAARVLGQGLPALQARMQVLLARTQALAAQMPAQAHRVQPYGSGGGGETIAPAPAPAAQP